MTSTSCPVCSSLPSSVTANTGRGFQLPETMGRLEAVVSFGYERTVYRCNACGDLFEWENLPQFYGSGNLDEERLSRLAPLAADVFGRLHGSEGHGSVVPSADSARELASAAFASLSIGLTRDVFQKMSWARRDRFEPFVPALVDRLVGEHDLTLSLMLLNFAKSAPSRARVVLAQLEKHVLPPKHHALFLRESCREISR